MINFRELLRKNPTEQELRWKASKSMAENAGVVEVMRDMALRLNEEGDSTVELWENSGKLSGDHTLTLLFDGDMAMADAYFKVHGYKGIRITTASVGDKKIEYTERDKWIELERNRQTDSEGLLRYDVFSVQSIAQEVSGLRYSMDLSKSNGVSFRE